jgi:hypothetical protein
MKENVMSDAPKPATHMGRPPAIAALHKHLGEMVDVWMRAKIAMLRHLEAKILLASTADHELYAKLREELHSAFLNEADIELFDQQVTRLLAVAEKHKRKWNEILSLKG